MTKKTSSVATKNRAAFPLPEWNSELKEPWHLDFEKEPVNDEKWSCIVTAAIQAEAQDEKYIQTYIQCVDTGLRKAVKIISMADVVKLLKESGKPEISEKREKVQKPKDPQIPKIVELANKFAVFSNAERPLPSDLMAAVLKHMILNLKTENCFAKRVAAVKERKIREQNLKAKFIRDLKPFETIQEKKTSLSKGSPNILELEKPINDEPIVGPDLYILLVDFYDVFIFPELLRINVPFLAFLKISGNEIWNLRQKSLTVVTKIDGIDRKKFAVNSFWETLKKKEIVHSEENMKFKDIIVLDYNCSCELGETKLQFFRNVFDELTWMQYSAYYIYSQHQKYLKELYVQSLTVSLEPLDLSECELYNGLCDALITGEPLTPLIVLYAIVEQVVAGVPETQSVTLEYEPHFTDFFPNKSESNLTTDDSPDLISSLVTPCKNCRDKQYKNVCEKLKKSFIKNLLPEKNERADKNSELQQNRHSENSPQINRKSSETVCSEFSISESVISKVISEKKTEKEMRKEKRWNMPSLCFYGDFVFLQTYFCDSRLIDPSSIIKRFLKPLEPSQIWEKYPVLLPEEMAFSDFHFFNFWKNTEESEERLKLKISFTFLSLQLIGIQKMNVFVGEEEKYSQVFSGVGKRKISKRKYKKKINNTEEEDENTFNNFFIKTFIENDKKNLLRPKIEITELEDEEESEISLSETESDFFTDHFLHKARTLMIKTSQNIPFLNFPQIPKNSKNLKNRNESKTRKISEPNNPITECMNLISKNAKRHPPEKILSSLINCSAFSNLTKNNFFKKKTDMEIIQDYKFYEKLNPNLMIQRLIEARKHFNTIQSSYFPPMDNVIIIMHNDFDERGIFFLNDYGTLPTPVCFRDFYSYVYPKIKNWLINENKNYNVFLSEIKQKRKAEKEKKDLNYLNQLKKEYCEMSEEKRKEFLETKVEVQVEPEVLEEDLGDLPIKYKPQNAEKTSFVVTNFGDFQVEINQKKHEFYSLDGTEVHAIVETWLYAPLKLQKLTVKKSKLLLCYNHWIDVEEINYSFTVKTNSDIIFSFYKNDTEKMDNFNYYVTISWPTGLFIRPVFHESNTYIKQSYLKTNRKGWDIEQESSRCFLKNGQVLIFHENGNYDILCGSGTKYTFKELGTASKYEIVSTTGEIWEVRSDGPCRNKKELIGSNKIFIGVSPKTQETFYRREDGVFFMLWQNGTLVTNYPDGTKITSTPFFEEEEVMIEWTEEEILHFEMLETKYRSESLVQEPISRTILRKVSAPKSFEKKSFANEGFVSVFCEYVMEHPKYSTIHFNHDPYITIKMPEQVSILIHPNGNYEVQQEKDFLKVDGSTVRFYTYCDDCEEQSTVTLNIDSTETLCRCVDFFKRAFFVFRNGSVQFRKFHDESTEEEKKSEDKKPHKNPSSSQNNCGTKHNKKMALMQRCFVLERDFNGLEFIHQDALAIYCHQLPEETYFDIRADDPTSCTFSYPIYTLGHEKWVMDYENDDNSLPMNIKKKDLKEMGTKETSKNLFKYPFPLQCVDRQQNEKPKRVTDSPKVVIGRTVRTVSEDPISVIIDMQYYVTKFEERAEELYKPYKYSFTMDDTSQDSSHVEMRLKKIAQTLNRNLQMYSHLGTQFPSTEKDVHYFGHFINFTNGMKDRIQDSSSILPDCKQIPNPLPRSSDFPDISEEI